MARLHAQIRTPGLLLMKITAHRDQQLVLSGQLAQLPSLVGKLTASKHLDGAAAGGAKISGEALQPTARQPVFQRVGQHRDATGGDNPAGNLLQAGPQSLDIARFAAPQIALKGCRGILHMALAHHPCGKVRAANLALSSLADCTLEGAENTQLLEPLADDLGTFPARAVQSLKAGQQHGVVNIHIEPHHMHIHPGPAAGELHTRHQPQPGDTARDQRGGLAVAGQRVVVGDGQLLHTPCVRTVQEGLGWQDTVRGRGMGVKIHQHNLRAPLCSATRCALNWRTIARPRMRRPAAQRQDGMVTRGPDRFAMKQLAEFIPIALFFIVYQMDGDTVSLANWTHTIDGIFSATAVLMLATVVQLLATWLFSHKLDRRSLWMGLAVLGFGAATLLLRNELFIQWKPTIFNWALALVFGASHFIGERNLMERTLGGQIQLPRTIWQRLNLLWTTHFAVVGALNLLVAYTWSEAAWVSYKLYSAIGFTVILTVLTAWLVAPHLKEETASEP